MRDVHRAFPDIKFTIEDAVESGDTIWVRVPQWSVAGSDQPVEDG
jgi:hypothetical protein